MKDENRYLVELHYNLLNRDVAPVHVWYKLRKESYPDRIQLEVLNDDNDTIGTICIYDDEPADCNELDKLVSSVIIDFERDKEKMFKQCAPGTEGVMGNLDTAFKAAGKMIAQISQSWEVLYLEDEDAKKIFQQVYYKILDDKPMKATDELHLSDWKVQSYYQKLLEKIDPPVPCDIQVIVIDEFEGKLQDDENNEEIDDE